MTILEQIIERYADEEILKADGFDEAIIGFDDKSSRLIYSRTKCVNILMERDGMTEIDAMEFFDFNVWGADMGEKTPIWCDDDFITE